MIDLEILFNLFSRFQGDRHSNGCQYFSGTISFMALGANRFDILCRGVKMLYNMYFLMPCCFLVDNETDYIMIHVSNLNNFDPGGGWLDPSRWYFPLLSQVMICYSIGMKISVPMFLLQLSCCVRTELVF